ncbi:MAG: hypothetical protein ACE5I4_04925 [Thermoplasmata archaeon]
MEDASESAYKEAIPILVSYERLRDEGEFGTPTEEKEEEPPEGASRAVVEEDTILPISPTDSLELRLPRTVSLISLAKSALDIVLGALEEKERPLDFKPKKEEFDL